MRKKSCLYEIEAHRETMSRKELKIADFIVADPGQAVHPSLEQLAARIGVSDTTLFRFVRKIGYSGYQQFRIALATETVEPRAPLQDENIDDVEAAVRVVFGENRAALEGTFEVLDRGAVDRSALALSAARRVHVFGLGGSQLVAQDACSKLVRCGLPCSAPTDFHYQLMQASQIQPGDVALLVSHSGANKDTLALASQVNVRGGSLVVITSRERSPLAKMADEILLASGAASPFVSGAFSARIAHLSLVDVLYLRIMKILDAPGRESLERMRSAIAPRRF